MNNNNIVQILNQIERNLKNKQEKEYFWIHSERYKFILHKIVGAIHVPLHQKNVLDIGCYPYHLGKALENIGFQVYGISSQHEPIIGNPRIKICNIETDKFPFPDEYFDLILWSEVLEHLMRTPKIPLREIKRVLKKDGICIITTPNVLRSINRFSMLFGRSIYPNNQEFHNETTGDASFNYRHNKEYTMNELEELINEVGMKIKAKEYFISYTPFRKRKIPDNFLFISGKMVNYLIMRILSSWRDTLYFEIGK